MAISIDVNGNGKADSNDQLRMTYTVTNAYTALNRVVDIGPLDSALTQSNGTSVVASDGSFVNVTQEDQSTWIQVTLGERISPESLVVTFYVTGASEQNMLACADFDVLYPAVLVSAVNGEANLTSTKATTMTPVCGFKQSNKVDQGLARYLIQYVNRRRSSPVHPVTNAYYTDLLNLIAYTGAAESYVDLNTTWCQAHEASIKTAIINSQLYGATPIDGLTESNLTLTYIVAFAPDLVTFITDYSAQLLATDYSFIGAGAYIWLSGVTGSAPSGVLQYWDAYWAVILGSID